MLVLSRKTGQSIEIGEEITVNVTQVKGNRVRLSIQAPRHIPIVRSEITTESDVLESPPCGTDGLVDGSVAIHGGPRDRDLVTKFRIVFEK